MIRFENMKGMKWILLPILSVLFFACEEEPPFIDLSEEQRILSDTSYVTGNIPPAQDKNILIEDISGVNCVNCPDAAIKAEEIKARTNGRVVVSTMLPDSNLLSEFTNPKDIFTDLTLNSINQLLNFIGPPSGLPTGMINRGDFGQGLTIPYPRWDGHVDDELLLTTMVNVELDKELSADKKTLIAKIKITYTDNPTDSLQNITLYLAENDITGVQKGRNGIMNNYVFQHVVRAFATSAVGDPIKVKLEKGRVIEREYQFDIAADWVPDNLEIIGLVHSRQDKYVYQATSLKLK
jgi:hypothetical protein